MAESIVCSTNLLPSNTPHRPGPAGGDIPLAAATDWAQRNPVRRSVKSVGERYCMKLRQDARDSTTVSGPGTERGGFRCGDAHHAVVRPCGEGGDDGGGSAGVQCIPGRVPRGHAISGAGAMPAATK